MAVPALDRLPDLDLDAVDYWLAFMELHRCRPSGYGPVGIPFTEVEAWLRVYQVTEPDDVMTFARIIGMLDNVWLDHQYKRLKESMKK